MRSKLGLPSLSQHTPSPSMMQDRDRRGARASTMRGKRSVRSLPKATERPSSGGEFPGYPAKSRSGVRLLSPGLVGLVMHFVMSAFAFAFVFAVLAKFL
jgi:hypothetical protein